MQVITNIINPDSVVFMNTYRIYNVLAVSEFHHHRINHSELFSDKKNHFNEIESFRYQAKRVLRKYNEINKKNFFFFKSVSSD